MSAQAYHCYVMGRVGDCSMAVDGLITNREASSICTEQVVTSEAFPYDANICGRENDCGKALTNFQPMCDEFNSVHKP